jgi:eukaryotic-like serine/threonine-protein kinase
MIQRPQAGDLIGGKYRVVRLLGEGGNGSVFEAENVLTEKRVAIKWLRATLGAYDDARERMLREAQSAARIKHRNVVDIYDAGFDDGVVFLVMELLEGETLANLLGTREVSIPELLSLLIPGLRGVAAAHRQGVIHRDLKPENLFLVHDPEQPEPHCVVLDFGVAKLSGSRALTTPGYAVGTPIFMPIEQLVGDAEVDARSDVHAIGVILYVALTGRSPHAGGTLRDMAMQMLTVEPLPVHQLRPELPLELCLTVRRAMSKDRSERHQSMDELIADLTPFAAPAGEAWGGDGSQRTRIVPHDLGTPSVPAGAREEPRWPASPRTGNASSPATRRLTPGVEDAPAQAQRTTPPAALQTWWLLAAAALVGVVL